MYSNHKGFPAEHFCCFWDPVCFSKWCSFFHTVSETDSVTSWAICELRDPWIRSNVRSCVNTWFAQPELLPIYSIFCVHSRSVYSGNYMWTYCTLRLCSIWLALSHWRHCASGTNAYFLGTQLKYSASCEDFIILLVLYGVWKNNETVHPFLALCAKK